MEKDNKANLSEIKKVTTSSSIYRVNRLLNDEWKILEIQKKDPGDPTRTYETVIYHLGHTDPKANEYNRDENKIVYTKPEDL